MGSKVQLMRLFDTSTQIQKEAKMSTASAWKLGLFFSADIFLPYLEALVSVSVECCP